jgi:hypothetical protein
MQPMIYSVSVCDVQDLRQKGKNEKHPNEARFGSNPDSPELVE